MKSSYNKPGPGEDFTVTGIMIAAVIVAGILALSCLSGCTATYSTSALVHFQGKEPQPTVEHKTYWIDNSGGLRPAGAK